MVGTVHGVAESDETDKHALSINSSPILLCWVCVCVCVSAGGEGETPHSVRSGKPFEGDMFD